MTSPRRIRMWARRQWWLLSAVSLTAAILWAVAWLRVDEPVAALANALIVGAFAGRLYDERDNRSARMRMLRLRRHAGRVRRINARLLQDNFDLAINYRELLAVFCRQGSQTFVVSNSNVVGRAN